MSIPCRHVGLRDRITYFVWVKLLKELEMFSTMLKGFQIFILMRNQTISTHSAYILASKEKTHP